MNENNEVMPLGSGWEHVLPVAAMRSFAVEDQKTQSQLDEMRQAGEEHASRLFARRMAGTGKSLAAVLEQASHLGAVEDARLEAEQRRQSSGTPIPFDGKAHVQEVATVARMKARREQAERDAADPQAAHARRIRASIEWKRLNG
jgi:hypothetical protein